LSSSFAFARKGGDTGVRVTLEVPLGEVPVGLLAGLHHLGALPTGK